MTAQTTDVFISRFFSPPNVVWPNADPGLTIAGAVEPFLKALSKRGECPLILPRRDMSAQAALLYVVCWDTAHAGRVRALLEAAVAHHWCPFDGRVARLNPEDAVDAAVLDLVGPGATYVLRPTPQTARQTFVAVQRLAQTLGDVPLRRPNLVRPIGRMLREFELALASGAAETSAELLREIEALGGISHENVAFLQIRRLARLGKDQELLAHGSLPTLVYTEPPRLVREGVLGAWARVHLARPLAPQGVDFAVEALGDAKPDVAMLVDEALASSGDPDVSTACALVAIARQDTSLAARFALNSFVDGSALDRLNALVEAPTEPHVERSAELPLGVPTEIPKVEPGGIDSWLAWVAPLASTNAMVLEPGQVQNWEPAWSVDVELAEAIDALPALATDDLLTGVAGFLETDDPDRPAPRTAVALLSRYLVEERFGPQDLGAICALLEVFLRGAPTVSAYREVLGDVRAFAPQWVAVSTAARALDVADVVACGPATDVAARSDFVATLLSPLNQQKRRLPVSLHRLASLVTDDLGLDFDWTIAESEPVAPVGRAAPSVQILLYSLDPGTLARVEEAIGLQWPGARVQLSSDKVGNPSLKQHARKADLIVVATRRAAHAATGFITENAAGALIRYPDGAGSASMLRTVEDGMAELAE